MSQNKRSTTYAGARGFQNQQWQQMRISDLISQGRRKSGAISNMWYGAQGVRQAALHGATPQYDWKTYMETAPLKASEAKSEKKSGTPGRPMPDRHQPPIATPGGATTPSAPGAAAPGGGLAAPSNSHFLYNVRGMQYPAGALGGQNAALPPAPSPGLAVPNNNHFAFMQNGQIGPRRGALPPGSQFNNQLASPQVALGGGGGWNKANAIDTTEGSTAMPGAPSFAALNAGTKQRRKAGGNPEAVRRAVSNWPQI